MYQQVMNCNNHGIEQAETVGILQNQGQNNIMYPLPGPVIGLQALCAACSRIYPDQPNPLQVTARIKYWLGGPDPLDYISMYWNPGRPDLNVPPHWHYVSFGLSDLHGDGRVHPPPLSGPPQADQLSGLGLELSFRVVGESGRPPTWPAALLQRLATYVFKTGNRLCVGDHVSWHSALDGSDEIVYATPNGYDPSQNVQTENLVNPTNRRLKIRHMLIAQDAQLGTVDTPLGKVQFVQVVGITSTELKAAQRYGGSPVLEALSSELSFGGSWLVTDIERNQSVSLPSMADAASDLSGVAAVCRWEQWTPPQLTQPSPGSPQNQNSSRTSSELSQVVKEQIRCVLQKGLSGINTQSSAEVSNEHIKDEPLDVPAGGNTTTNECKMSTDSVKFSFSNEYLKESFPADIAKLSISSPKPLAMSTDSFEMSKIENALIEDVLKLQTNSSDLKGKDELTNVKSEAVEKVEIDPESQPSSVCNCDNKEGVINDGGTQPKATQACNKCGRCPWIQTTTSLPGVHIIFDREAGSLLPLALRGRVLHGCHFTWTAVSGSQAITLVPPSVSGAIVSESSPIVAAVSGWLQILVPDNFAREMAEQLEVLSSGEGDESGGEEAAYSEASGPTSFCWPHRGLKISIYNKFI